MGCWYETCMISNLPITPGTPTYYVMLTEIPYEYNKGRPGCYVHDHWFLRAIPILGKYDDYGSIEDWEKGWIEDLIVEQFKNDLVEQAQNEREKLLGRPPHSKKDVSFSAVQDWLQEGGLRVELGKFASVGLNKLLVVKGFVRKDIWDHLLTLKPDSWREELSIEQIKKDVDKYLISLENIKNEGVGKRNFLGAPYDVELMMRESWTENTFVSPFVANPRPGPPCTNNVSFFKEWIDKKFLDGQLTAEEAREKYYRVAEVLHVQRVMDSLRKNWHPTCGTGSQSKEFDLALQFNLNVAAIAYQEDLGDLSEQMGFFDKDFEAVSTKTKRDKETLKYMKQVQSSKIALQSIVSNFFKRIDVFNSKMDTPRSEE